MKSITIRGRWRVSLGIVAEMPRIRQIFLLTLALLLLGVPSCEDKEKAAQSRLQQAKIAELEAQVEIMRASLSRYETSDDPKPELEDAKKNLEAAKTEVSRLQSEVEELEVKREQVKKEFEDYKRKYRIPN